MARKNELKARVTADTSDFNKNMKKIGATAKVAATAAVTAMTGMTLALVKLSNMMKNASQQSEDQRLNLVALYRDVDKGTAAFKRLQKVADNSALKTEEMVEAYLTLARNIGAKNVESFLDSMEDIGFASQQGRGGFIEAAEAVGRLINRFELFGKIDQDTLDTLKRTSGVSNEFIKMLQKMDKSTLTTTKLMSMLKKELAASAKLMRSEAANSISGLEALLAGKFSAALREAGGEQGAYKDILRALIDVIDELDKKGSFKKLAAAISEIQGEIAKTLKDTGFIEDMIKLLTDLTKVLMLVVKGFHSAAIAWDLFKIKQDGKTNNDLADVLMHLQQNKASNEVLRGIKNTYEDGKFGDVGKRQLSEMAEMIRSGKTLKVSQRESRESWFTGQQETVITNPETGEVFAVIKGKAPKQ